MVALVAHLAHIWTHRLFAFNIFGWWSIKCVLYAAHVWLICFVLCGHTLERLRPPIFITSTSSCFRQTRTVFGVRRVTSTQPEHAVFFVVVVGHTMVRIRPNYLLIYIFYWPKMKRLRMFGERGATGGLWDFFRFRWCVHELKSRHQESLDFAVFEEKAN